ncbi:GtrA family protein [Actinobacillus pleuropneumoniae]|uniref:GtrA family protein n=1 Tax=Actinobacillus pleuropneumoniae TaxID=715 RepID=UPI003B21028B|nr:GtrA family protein [Actinobacillus pleuropneumoniae]
MRTKILSKYILVGLANTLLTAITIFILMALDISLYISNVAGYVIGIIFSYYLNSKFTFNVETSHKRFIKFIITCGICYLINLVAIKLTLLVYYQEYLAQLVGMGLYTITGFIINKLWVMKK